MHFTHLGLCNNQWYIQLLGHYTVSGCHFRWSNKFLKQGKHYNCRFPYNNCHMQQTLWNNELRPLNSNLVLYDFYVVSIFIRPFYSPVVSYGVWFNCTISKRKQKLSHYGRSIMEILMSRCYIMEGGKVTQECATQHAPWCIEYVIGTINNTTNFGDSK